MQNALIVFAKLPAPGAVKTRLTPTLSPAEAAQLYEAFLRDALGQYLHLDALVRLYLAPPAEAVPGYLSALPISIHTQHGDDLGARMLHAIEETLADGAARAAVIGTDHPTLPTPFIQQAFAALEGPPTITIGPSADGGYYLLGMNAAYPVLFEGMAYSHPRVFAHTLDRARQTSAQLTVLPRWYDVDTPAALTRLIQDLQDPSVTAPKTRKAVAELNIEARLPATGC